MRRIVVIGSPGSGKSTLARRLGSMLGLEVIHLDMLYWHPGWVETPPEQWDAVNREIVRKESWIIDGHYGRTLDMRLEAADTVILLDMPRLLCIWRATRRRGKVRPDMPPELVEKFDWEAAKFMWYIWTFPARKLPTLRKQLEQRAAGKTMIVLRSPAEVERYVSELAAEHAPVR
ncbi:P-loop NTPase family protein [Paenibacillus cymbidii]|uniref:AAA family ATPase n=1 Tax=Paenibacillus cymbidii TaxID=1639034 RepID=UPI0010822CD5|nr:AAA family ATPase [Paenibacillus cymbidii]